MYNTDANLERFHQPQGARRAPRDRRLRHRLLLALLPAPLPDRHPEDRPLLRRQPHQLRQRPGARARRHHARRDARTRHGGRGHRAGAAGRGAAGARLRRRAGVPVRQGGLARAALEEHRSSRAATRCGRRSAREELRPRAASARCVRSADAPPARPDGRRGERAPRYRRFSPHSAWSCSERRVDARWRSSSAWRARAGRRCCRDASSGCQPASV